MKKLVLSIFTLTLFLPLALTEKAQAQWSIGASYEIRDENPTNGFGLRIERDILDDFPLLDLGIRGHFSFFNEENDISREGGINFSREFQTYDLGIAAVAGISIGLIKPYVGLGIGSEQFKLDTDSVDDSYESFDENNFYWNGFGGAELTVLPFLSPFIEYRISRLTGADDVHYDNISRLAIGVSLKF